MGVKVRKETLILAMDGLYAVGFAELDGRPYYLATSEKSDGRVCAVDCETREIHEIRGGYGGVMSILASCRDNALLSIEKFYPGFRAPRSIAVEIVLKRTGGKWDMARRRQLAVVPYLHRLSMLKEGDRYFLAAGQLARKKDYTEDWSSAGDLMIAPYPQETPGGSQLEGDGPAVFETMPDDIHKHHAMLVRRDSRGDDEIFYGGEEGAFRAKYTGTGWKTEKILDIPVSEIVKADLDNDGKEELAVIEGFHGNKAAVFKELSDGSGYRRVFEFPLELGHVLWGGDILGAPALIAGSRSGRGELSFRRFAPEECGRIRATETVILDEGGGPAQLYVRQLPGRVEVLAACYLTGDLKLYTLY